MRKFVSYPLKPTGQAFAAQTAGREPPVPAAFSWGDRILVVAAVVRSWRSIKTDRGDAYLKRHWFELALESGGRIEVYYDRDARRGAQRWWLYAIDE